MAKRKRNFWFLMLMMVGLTAGGAAAHKVHAETSVAQVELVGELPSTGPDPTPPPTPKPDPKPDPGTDPSGKPSGGDPSDTTDPTDPAGATDPSNAGDPHGDQYGKGRSILDYSRLPQTGDAVQPWLIVIGVEVLLIVILSAVLVHGRSRQGGKK
ncbi:LPXTG cell wall anchor domain-containing protein [Lacticaseibacillus casei]|jgi:LPXTG-motif cell wall-anchored protein|uniref:LPXTG cell wall anchor domain-containing protein n=1 Tax=Lacticaseibacillus huelsenbergensis TaxID=3035291 RepID=A0ABY8DMK2_9LACO|nr:MULTISPECIES: LPXTG cell wall anchor domain-containing protein [Lacticaseibacillus]MDG3062770.1 LPXTG cell wall anchor domain-containing protein [Lacticaseibacillus sp. BCRC 81376]QVI38502.1 LPXTG cell wall anchor domain-containing protein [Lacticaseibacillus casei]QXG60314.1 LPXTG cell wall anchor domain-containing protein [Lacticaseibacillus casei]WFB38206.1 LPXTG cell wall anchor domain-containing protein [Lacticaseibacillus huelsenbergensis]WFB42631.1 LPXTG cell wall anchor domain-conta